MKMRMIDGYVIHLSNDPAREFHPSIAQDFIDVPADAPSNLAVGFRYDAESEATWIEPSKRNDEPANDTDPAPARRSKLTPAEFRNSFSAFEEVAINEFAAARPDGEPGETTTLRKVVGVFFDRVRDPHLTVVDLDDPRNQAGLDLLVSVGILTQARRDEISAGLPA